MISKYFALDDNLKRLEMFHGGKKTKYFFLKLKIVFSLLIKGKISIMKLYNIFISFYSYLFKLKTSGKTPVVINFELSNKCNERCVFCRDEKGIPASASLFLFDDKMGYYLIGANDDGFLQPGYLLV